MAKDYKLLGEAYQTIRENMLGAIASPGQQLTGAVQGGLARAGGYLGQQASNLYNRAGQAVDAFQGGVAGVAGDQAGVKAQQAQAAARGKNIKDPGAAAVEAAREALIPNVINQLLGGGLLDQSDIPAFTKDLEALIKKHGGQAAKKAPAKAAPAAPAAPAVAAAPARPMTPTTIPDPRGLIRSPSGLRPRA